MTSPEKKLPFEVQTVKLHEGGQHAAAHVQTSFTARVPALVDGDFSLSESSAIVEYLEDKWPAPEHASLLPRDLQQRARAPAHGLAPQRPLAHPRRTFVRVRVLSN